MQFENTERGDLSNTRVSSPLVPLPLLGPRLWWRQFIQTHRDQVQNKATAHRHVVVILCLDHSFVFRGFDKLDGSVSHTWYVPPESSVHRNKSSEAERDNGAYHVTTQHDLELATNFGGELSEMEPLNNHRHFGIILLVVIPFTFSHCPPHQWPRDGWPSIYPHSQLVTGDTPAVGDGQADGQSVRINEDTTFLHAVV